MTFFHLLPHRLSLSRRLLMPLFLRLSLTVVSKELIYLLILLDQRILLLQEIFQDSEYFLSIRLHYRSSHQVIHPPFYPVWIEVFTLFVKIYYQKSFTLNDQTNLLTELNSIPD